MTLAKLFAIAGVAAGILSAQDPPSRVARLNLMQGQVSFQPDSLDTWTAASLNYPLTTGDHLYTDTDSRAEMHVGPNAIRLDSHSNFGFLNLDDRTVQMRFTEGAMEVRVRVLDDHDVYEVDTPNGAVSLLRTGDYRIDTDPDRNATMVTVFSGEVEVTAGGQSFAVHPRQTAFFSDDAPPDVRTLNPADDFDRFTMDRNGREDRMPLQTHVSPSMVGYEDVATTGNWSEVPEYGWVWAPPVRAGWVPYHDGHWAWVEPWGWTWIDDAPWGFAPFHYGRWASMGGRWVWIPGPPAVRPVYAPALVAFVGGPRFSVGIGIGGGMGAIAWFPLGPREVYRPEYAVSPAYVRNVNVTNVTNINVTNVNVTNVRYVNQTVPGAVTAVPQNAFTGARSVGQVARPVSQQQLAEAQVIGHGPTVAPQRESVMGAAFAANVARPSAVAMNRQVVARATPPPASVSFQSRQAAIVQNQGRPLAPQQVIQLRQQQPAGIVNRAPVRVSPVPATPVQAPSQPIRPAFQGGRPDAQPNAMPAPANRLDSRPPNVQRPAVVNPNPAPPQQQAPAVNRPMPEQSRPAPEMRPLPQNRPVPEARPVPENRPAPETRPLPQSRPVPEARQAPENRPAPEARPIPENRPAPAARPPANEAPRKGQPPRKQEENKDRKE